MRLANAFLRAGLCAAVLVSAGSGVPAQERGRWRAVSEPVFKGKVWLYDTGGAKNTTVLLVHGVGREASDVWRPLITSLEKKYHVVAFDMPGFGKSSKGNLLYSPENYAKLIRFVAGTYRKERLVVVGHSLGGAAALYFAGQWPHDLDRLVLIDAAGVLNRTALVKGKFLIEPESKGLRYFAEGPLSGVNNLIESTIGKIDRGLMPQDLSEYVDNELFRKAVLKNDAARIAGIALVGTDFSEQLYSVRVPTCILWGGMDEIAPVRTAVLLSSVIPRTDLEILEGIGHDPVTDSPDDTARLLHRFIEMDDAVFLSNDVSPPNGGNDLDLVGKTGMELTGDYGTVSIDGCRQIVLRKMSARSLIIRKSTVTIERGTVVSAGTALSSMDSKIAMTGVTLTGEIGIEDQGTEFDLAGVTIRGRIASVRSMGDTKLAWSVSRIKSPRKAGYLHGDMVMKLGDSL